MKLLVLRKAMGWVANGMWRRLICQPSPKLSTFPAHPPLKTRELSEIGAAAPISLNSLALGRGLAPSISATFIWPCQVIELLCSAPPMYRSDPASTGLPWDCCRCSPESQFRRYLYFARRESLRRLAPECR